MVSVAPAGSLARARRRLARDHALPVAAVSVAIAGLPMLRPKGPGNSAPADFLIAVAVGVVVLWAASVRARLRVPYAAPVTLIVVAGAVAGLAGDHPVNAVQALVQDLFLLAWCAAIATLARTPTALAAMLKVWAWSSIAWAGFLVAAVAAGQRALAGLGAHGGGRARLMFDHPNLAGSYFVVSLFVIVLAGRPRNRLARGAALLLLSAAVVLTGSNAALIGLAIGGVATVTVSVARRVDVVAGVAVLLIAVTVGAAGWFALSRAGVASAVDESENRFLRYSVARGDRSLAARQGLFGEEFDLFKRKALTGIGPASTFDLLSATPTVVAKEAHSDYLAALVERGPLGAAALLLLITAVAFRVVGSHAPPAAFRSAAPGVAALVGAVVVVAFGAITHEVLHYRHVWALFGILAAIHAASRGGEPAAVEGSEP